MKKKKNAQANEKIVEFFNGKIKLKKKPVKIKNGEKFANKNFRENKK